MAHLCVFRVGQQTFALPIHQVRQVVESAECTEVPLSRDAVVGLMNLRGRVVTSIDTRIALDLERDGDVPPVHLVVFATSRLLSLRVDDVEGVTEVASEEVRPVPANLPGPRRAVATGVVMRDDDLTLLLDAERIAAALVSPEVPA